MNDFIKWINELIETQNNLVLICAIILFLFIVSSIIKNLTIIFDAIEKGCFTLKKLLITFLALILYPFKLIIKVIRWIFNIKARHDYKKEVLESEYNVYPEEFKIPMWRKIFSYKIRRDAHSRFRCIEKCIETQEFINSNMKYITLIETSVGGGKSSLMAGLTHYKTIHFQQMIQEKIENTQKILFKLDWNKINYIIERVYSYETNISSILDTILQNEEIEKQLNGFYNNYRQDTPKKTLLEDYITAYCALLRNNYVMANYRLYNHITDTFNIDLAPELFDIKTPSGLKNYYIPAYSIIAEDELSLSKLKNTNSYIEIDNSGRDTSMRLFRQLKNETCFYIGCSQNISRNAKIFRELANTYFEILSMDIVGVQKNYSRIFQKKEQKLINKLTKKKYIDRISEFKEKIYNLYQEQNKIYASGFIRYTVRLSNSAKDLERFDKSMLKTTELFMPMTWCFGTYLKCQFNEFDKYLNDISNKSDADLKIIDSFFESSDPKTFESLIKVKEKEEKKESKKKGG